MAFASRVFSHNEGNVYEQEYRLGFQEIEGPEEIDSNGYEEASWPLLSPIRGGGVRKDAWTVSLTLFHALLLAFGVFYIQAGSRGIRNAEGMGESRTTTEPTSSVWGWTAVGSGEGSVTVTYWLCVTAVLLGFLMSLFCLLTFFALYRWLRGYPALLKAVHGFTMFFLLFWVVFGMALIGYWDDNSSVTSEATTTTVNHTESLLLSNPFHGPTKFWMITLTIMTTLLILINLLTYLGISDEDLYIKKPTLRFTSLVIFTTGVTIVVLLSYAMLTHTATTSPVQISSASSTSSSSPSSSSEDNQIELKSTSPSFFANPFSSFANPFSTMAVGVSSAPTFPYHWTVYATLGTACGILLGAAIATFVRASYYPLLMVLMPLLGGVCVVSASINFYQEDPSHLVAIADLAAIGVQVFMLLMFVNLWLMRKFHNDNLISGYHHLIYELRRSKD